MIDHIHRAASDRWHEILALPLLRDDHQGQPCPRCGGNDRFHVDREYRLNGTVYCRHCLPKGSGDGIGTYAWLHGIENSEAIKRLASELGIAGDSDSPKLDLIDAVCRDKRMPRDAFMQFGPTIEKRGKLDVVRIPVWDAKGNQHSFFDLWPGDKGKFKRGEGSQGLFLPGRLPKPGEQWLLVEGVKDASALIGLGYEHVCGLPTNSMNANYATLFRGCDIIIVPDLDSAGQHGASQTGGRLIGIAATVRIARLTGDVVDKSGQDVRDVLRQRGADAVKSAIDGASPWEPAETEQSKDERPEVLLILNEAFVADQAVKHLGNLGWITDWIPVRIREQSKVYVRAGQLVHVVPSEDPSAGGRLGIHEMPSAIIRERITQACQLQTEGTDPQGNIVIKPGRPPKWLIDAIAYRGHYGGLIRSLVGIIQSPTLRADGTIIQTAGYDSASGLLYRPNAEYPRIEENPTRDDAVLAWESLSEVVADFPFVSGGDKSAWLAMLLSMIARPCVSGCVPLYAITATTAGSGKGKLCDAATLIAYGHEVSKKGFPTKTEELAKQITSLLIEGAPCHVFDNLDCTLRGAELDALLTTTTWKDRVLGLSKTTGELPARTVWVATGNNIQFGSDTSRRVLPIRLSPNTESPETRTDFRHSNLMEWIRENRPRLVADAITFIRAYFVAGCPKVDSTTWGSFEDWTSIIRGSIVWAGLEDPMGTRESVAESDETKEQALRIIAAVEQADPESKGKTIRELADLYRSFPEQVPLLVDVANELCRGQFIPKRVSSKLLAIRGRILDGKRLDSENAGKGLKRWRVTQPTEGWLGWLGGFDSITTHREKQFHPNTDNARNAYPYTSGVETIQPNQPNQPKADSPQIYEVEL